MNCILRHPKTYCKYKENNTSRQDRLQAVKAGTLERNSIRKKENYLQFKGELEIRSIDFRRFQFYDRYKLKLR